MSSGAKVCTTCKTEKPIERFGVNKKGRQKGIRAMCKDCQKVKDRQPKNRYSQQRSANNKRGVKWDLPFDYYVSLISKPCEYCELELNPTGSGLDRIVAELGYIEGNVVPCCATCNMFKARALTYEEMKTEIGPAVRRIRLKRRELGLPEPQSCAYYWTWHKDKVRA